MFIPSPDPFSIGGALAGTTGRDERCQVPCVHLFFSSLANQLSWNTTTNWWSGKVCLVLLASVERVSKKPTLGQPHPHQVNPNPIPAAMASPGAQQPQGSCYAVRCVMLLFLPYCRMNAVYSPFHEFLPSIGLEVGKLLHCAGGKRRAS